MQLVSGLIPRDRMRLVWPLVSIAAVSAVVFGWLSDAVGEGDGVTAVDGPIAVWFASHRDSAEGRVGIVLAQATAPAVLVSLLVAVSAVLWWRRYRLESALLGTATVLAYGAGGVAKLAEGRVRPLAPVNLAPDSEASFPSGHVLVIATIACVALGLAWAYLDRAARILATVAAVSVTSVISADRLVVGAHWLTDVVGALVLAAMVSALVLAAHRLLRAERLRSVAGI